MRTIWAGPGRRALVALGLVLAPFVMAQPAAAHGSGPHQPRATNWRSTLTSSAHPAPGITVQVTESDQLVLENRSAHEVTVVGYEGEPYLRVGPDGVFENRRSPATYLNRSTDARTPVPALADPEAEPAWVRRSHGTTASWHDHRTHWMGGRPPARVRDAPDQEHVVIERWSVPIRVDGREIEVTGRLVWVPPPPAWPWALAIVLATALAAVAARTPAGPTVLGLSVLAVAVADSVGASLALDDPPSSATAAVLVPAVLVVIGLALPRSYPRRTAVLTVGTVLTGLVLGAAHASFLTHSQLPTALPPLLARLCVVAALGIGVGAAVGAVVRRRSRVS